MAGGVKGRQQCRARRWDRGGGDRHVQIAGWGAGEGGSSAIPISLNGWEGAGPAPGLRGSEGTLGDGRREPGRFWKGDFSGTRRAGARGPEHLTKAKGVLGDTYRSSWRVGLLERRRVCLVRKGSGPSLQDGGWTGGWEWEEGTERGAGLAEQSPLPWQVLK